VTVDLDAVRALIAAATPFEWRVVPYEGGCQIDSAHGCVADFGENENRDADAALIAACPTLLAELVAELERLRESAKFLADASVRLESTARLEERAAVVAWLRSLTSPRVANGLFLSPEQAARLVESGAHHKWRP
jgi:hypothetical protein